MAAGPAAPAQSAAAEITLQNTGLLGAGGGGAALASWLATVLATETPAVDSLTVRFVRRPEMERLNSGYRGRPGPTDVLSFSGGPTPEGLHLGDLVICAAIARRQARQAKHPFERELRLLLLHGVLHCLGHDHDSDDGEMDELERRWRARWLDG